ncbi:leucyl/phenylalanyl-tRNA--protein transferase [Agarivorans aestuarii]|uniref:Leucyl/phenylalanyl-tRNA--protein transferase n=1 Tax=Agarivorans aestuarii TaxID=1563703 RepID=A0ABU7FZD1_9ALTE|nr:leucyl/phenylalanyl-tRNA--protein transferase [Agarivorans aestuarii]MEE1672465.1 leucyl/phenylalanyl-tRNA--protein transferase [Agarivorans aestuarii]
MHPVFLELNRPFPSPNHALEDPNGLLAIGADLSPQRLIAAYDNGIFPWFSDDQPVLWWSPNPRIGLDLSAHNVNKSMQKFIRRTTLKVTVNNDFPQVIERCAALRTDETWINQEMIKAYIALHQLERAHSVEVWNGEELVGGLYGVLVGEVFCGESMFHTETNASKLAFHRFCQHFKQHGGVYIDGQVENPHLLSLGMEAIERECFLNLLNKHKNNKVDAKCWQQQVIF